MSESVTRDMDTEDAWDVVDASPTLTNVQLFDQGLRRCNRCGHVKVISDEHFFRDRDGPQGWSRKCKDCDREYQNKRNAKLRRGLHTPRQLGANQYTYVEPVDLGERPRD